MTDGEGRRGPAPSFEANLRGKLKQGFGLNPGIGPSNAATSTSTGTIQNAVDIETPQEQVDAEDPDNNGDNEVTDSDGDEETEQAAGSGTETDNDTNEEGSLASGPASDDETDEGMPSDDEGYHNFSKIPVTLKMLTAVMHDEGKNWLKKNLPFPEGIPSPEGYQWGRDPGDLLWVELGWGSKKRASLSQICVMDKKNLQIFKVNEDGSEESTPTIQGASDDPSMLRLLCGEPQLFRSIPYWNNPALLEFAGPDCLDTYIPPSELPLWLHVYDEDNLTLYPEDDLTPADVKWLSGRHPLLPIPSGIKPLKYRLVDPSGKNVRDENTAVDSEQNHATLILSGSRAMRTGSYCHFIEGQIALQNPKFPSMLRLVAKISHHPGYNEKLKNEASMYSLFPESFSREYSGVQLVSPSQIPRRLSQVVPMFYGYYEHVEEPDAKVGEDEMPESVSNNVANSGGDEEHHQIPAQMSRSPILLTENCGERISPLKLTQYQKLEIVSLVHRFHKAGFIHHALTSRNSIVSQPGPPGRFEPLSLCPKWARSSKRPSFRLNGFEDSWWVGLQSQKELFEQTHGQVYIALMAEKRRLGRNILMKMIP